MKVIFQTPSVDEQLMATAQEINKHCPIVVDSLMRLDNTIALPNHKLQYNYTFYKTEKATIDTIALQKNMKQFLVNKLKTDPKLTVFKKSKVLINARFYDKTGNYVCNLSVTPAEYDK